MRNLAAVLVMVGVAAACKPATQAPAAIPKAGVSPTQPSTAAPAQGSAAQPVIAVLPKVCEDYLARAEACLAKSSGAQAVRGFRQSLQQARAQWQTMADKASLATSCEQATAQFGQITMLLKCE